MMLIYSGRKVTILERNLKFQIVGRLDKITAVQHIIDDQSQCEILLPFLFYFSLAPKSLPPHTQQYLTGERMLSLTQVEYPSIW